MYLCHGKWIYTYIYILIEEKKKTAITCTNDHLITHKISKVKMKEGRLSTVGNNVISNRDEDASRSKVERISDKVTNDENDDTVKRNAGTDLSITKCLK